MSVIFLHCIYYGLVLLRITHIVIHDRVSNYNSGLVIKLAIQ